MIANSAQHAKLDPTFRSPQRADIFTDAQGMTQSVFRTLKSENKEQWRVVYEYAGWKIVTSICQEADHRYREIESARQEHYWHV